MSLETGQTLLHYRLASKIGEGGMGVVWKAMDTSLGREVAIKVLPAALAGDASRLSRFEREARLLATLSHPNIAGVYGLHEADGVRFIAMELVGGEDLSHWLQRGLPSMDDALDVALQVARALEAAHGSGVIHRDLKPANVVRGDDGRVKVLDFGLAKAMEGEGTSGSSPSMSPTLTSAGTLAGMMMGTAAYMSPEQARGRPVDRRTDIWAFGCLLYELLTGARVFGGDNISDALAALLRSEPDWAALPAATPPAICRLLRRLLAKDPDERLHDIADARLEISGAQDEPEPIGGTGTATSTGAAPGGKLARLLPWMVAAVAVAAAGWLALQSPGPAAPPAATARVVTSILPPAGMGFDLGHGLALSPDGSRLVFAARDARGKGGLWLRSLDEATARPLAGTDGAVMPFWAPDGRKLGFQADGKLKTLDLFSGVVESLTELTRTYGATWGEHGDIVYGGGDVLFRIAATGGESRRLSEAEQPEDRQMWPSFLPGGRHFLYHVRRYGGEERSGQVRIGALDSPESTLLFSANSGALYMPPGYLVWWEGGNLRVQGFDAASRTLKGQPTALVADVRFDPRSASAAFGVSGSGLLVYQQGGAEGGNELVWLDRQGNDLGTVGPPGSLYSPSLSPDGSRIAVDISGETNQGDIWVIDAARGSATRLTAAQEDESCPIWSPDGASVAYCSLHGVERFAVLLQSTRGGAGSSVAVQDPARGLSPADWLGDDLLVTIEEPFDDIYAFSFQDNELRPYVATPFNERAPAFAPDGRHVAYVSDQTGRDEIYVQTFPQPTESVRVSADGGMTPRWHPDGNELFFMSPGNEFMTAKVDRLPGADDLEFGKLEALFTVDIKSHDRPQWDLVSGDRFLFNRNIRAGAKDALTLVQGWQPGLQ